MGISVLFLAAITRSWRRPAGAQSSLRDTENRPSLDSAQSIPSATVEEAIQSANVTRFMFSDNPTPMWVLDYQTSKVVAVNDAALFQFGYTRDEFLAASLNELLPGVSPEVLLQEGAQQCGFRKKNGNVVQVQLSGPSFALNGRPVRLLAAKDVDPGEMRLTAFVRLGQRLCAARTQREAVEIILDAADQFFGWDACTFDSYSREEDMIHPIVVIDRLEGERREVPPVVKDRPPTARMRKVIEEGPQLILRQAPIQMPADSVPMGDQNRPSASLMYVPVRSGQRVIGLLSIQSYTVNAYTQADLQLLQALTDHGAGALERIQAEEKVIALNAQLEERIAERTAALQQTVGELEAFSYSVSHDMRAPLRAMQGFAEKLLEDYSGKVLDAEASGYLCRISRAAVRLDTLIQDVLTYTKVLRAEVPMEQVDLGRLIEDLIESYPEWRLPKAEIRIHGQLPTVQGNEALLTQCISNLISNGLKFVPQGITPQVTIWAESLPAHSRIYFQDNGVGIAPENHARIFRLFERVYPTSQFEGTGVGLTIVRKAVERMNGQVGFESELGKGSKFWIQL